MCDTCLAPALRRRHGCEEATACAANSPGHPHHSAGNTTATGGDATPYAGMQAGTLSMLMCAAIGAAIMIVFGAAIRLEQYCAGEWPTDEMRSRGNINSMWLNFLFALASAVGVAVGLVNDNAASMVGTAISASLLPPAVNAGMFWGYIAVHSIYNDPDFLSRPSCPESCLLDCDSTLGCPDSDACDAAVQAQCLADCPEGCLPWCDDNPAFSKQDVRACPSAPRPLCTMHARNRGHRVVQVTTPTAASCHARGHHAHRSALPATRPRKARVQRQKSRLCGTGPRTVVCLMRLARMPRRHRLSAHAQRAQHTVLYAHTHPPAHACAGSSSDAGRASVQPVLVRPAGSST